MAKLDKIWQDSLSEVIKTRELGQKTGAGIVESTFAETNADEVNERLKAAVERGKADNEAARATATEETGQQQTQQGGTQVMIGQTMMAGAGVMAASGLGAIASVGTFAAGAALVATGQGNQAQGEQKVAEAPPMTAKATAYNNQSENHLNKAEQIRSQQETEQAAAEDSSDPDSAKETGKDKGYYVADSGNAGASTDDELVADRLTDGEKAINEKLGISTASATDGDGTAATDESSIASRLNTITDNIKGLVDTKADQTDGEAAVNKELGITTDSDTKENGIGVNNETSVANRLKDGAGEVNDLLGVEKEKVG
jgi:hypothetical protein